MFSFKICVTYKKDDILRHFRVVNSDKYFSILEAGNSCMTALVTLKRNFSLLGCFGKLSFSSRINVNLLLKSKG